MPRVLVEANHSVHVIVTGAGYLALDLYGASELRLAGGNVQGVEKKLIRGSAAGGTGRDGVNRSGCRIDNGRAQYAQFIDRAKGWAIALGRRLRRNRGPKI